MSGVSKDDDTFGRDHGLVHEAIVTSRKAGWTRADWAKFAHDQALVQQALHLVRGKAKLHHLRPSEICSPSLIIPNRSMRPACPAWVGAPVYPGLEEHGPAEYDLSEVKLWYHLGQTGKGRVRGFELYTHFHDKKVISPCLGLADGYAIAQKPAALYKKVFGTKKVCLWKSVSYIAQPDGDAVVPYLRLREDGDLEWVEIDWIGLHRAEFDASIPAGHFE